MMGGIVYYAGLDNPKLEKAEINLISIEKKEVNSMEDYIKLQAKFLVKNPTDKTFTVPLIVYELFANGISLGTWQYSTEDIAMPGRAAFYPNTEIPLTHVFRLVSSDNITEVYDMLINDEYVKFNVKGTITLETAWSITDKMFESAL